MDRLMVDAEKRLVEKCLAGDRRAWEEFFECYMRSVSAVVSRPQWGFQAHEREDLAQEVVKRLILSLRDFQFRSKLSTFVCAVAVNTCVGEVRKRAAAKRRGDSQCVGLDVVGGAAHEEALETPADRAKNQEQLLLECENADSLRSALGALDRECRRLLRLRYYDDMSFKEIAQQLKLRENSLVVQARRCLVRMLKLMKVKAQDGPMQNSRVQEMLAAALWPEDFPKESDAIVRHATECPYCRRELDRLKTIHRSLVFHKALLASTEEDQALPAGSLFSQRAESGLGASEDAHEWGGCDGDEGEREIIAEIESLTKGPCSMTPQEARMVGAALDRYAPPDLGARAPESLFVRGWKRMRESFQPVPLVLGAALASLIFLLSPVVFHEKHELITVASDTQWNVRRLSLMKGNPQGPAPTETALVILAPKDRPLLTEEVAALYKEIDLVQAHRKSFSFLSPEETGKIVGKDRPVSGVAEVRDVVFEKSGVTYLLTFEIMNSFSGYAVRGALFKRGQGHDLGSVSQTGMRFTRLPARISAMSAALLEEAAQ